MKPIPHVFQLGLLAFLLLLNSMPIQAQESQNRSSNRSEQQKPDQPVPWAHLTESSAVLIRIDLGRLNFPKAAAERLQAAVEKEGVEQWPETSVLQESYEQIRQQLGQGIFYLIIDLPTANAQPKIQVLMEDSPAADPIQNAELFSRFEMKFQKSSSGWLVAEVRDPRAPGDDDSNATQPFPGNSETRDLFTEGFQSCNDDPMRAVVVPPRYLWRTYEEIMPELPVELGGGPTTRLTRGMQWMAISLDPDGLNFGLTIGSENPAAAKEFSGVARRLIAGLMQQLPLPQEKIQEMIQLCEKINIRSEGKRVVWREQGGEFLNQLIQVAGGVTGQTLDSATDQKVKNDLRQLALAIHNYESALLCFPPAAKFRDDHGEPGLSWRVHLLPFLDEITLYRQFKLDEPWDSPHNKALIPLMPPFFQTRSNPFGPDQVPIPAGHTTLLAPVGEGTIFGGRKPIKFTDIIDGTSNTIMLVEVQPEFAVPWTAPQDYRFDPADPAKGLRLNKDGKFSAALADGSVREISGNLPAETIESLFRMNDGKIVNFD